MSLRIRLFIVFTILLFFNGCSPYRELSQTINKHSWTTVQLQSSISWKSYHFLDLFGSKQYINIIDLDLKDTSFKIDIVHHDSLLQLTSTMAQKANAIAAINGNFFHTKEGGSVCYFKLDGSVFDTSRTDLTESLFLSWLDEGAVCFNADGALSIKKKPKDGWPQLDSIPTVLSSGPMLISDGDTLALTRHSFNDSRYSRTGIGITKKNHILFVTIDGNSTESAGMTTHEMAILFQKLGCLTALNLDGGGSTTMWVNGQADNGIVSHPTDNKRFDHFGERKVANCLIIK